MTPVAVEYIRDHDPTTLRHDVAREGRAQSASAAGNDDVLSLQQSRIAIHDYRQPQARQPAVRVSRLSGDVSDNTGAPNCEAHQNFRDRARFRPERLPRALRQRAQIRAVAQAPRRESPRDLRRRPVRPMAQIQPRRRCPWAGTCGA
ncbi:Uncharacterised protein [Mycobacteroides abscessus subsp. abscessus]|nr:Uncharacterised protein [Mycobacteroides abscessus subsp. abscessus]